MKHLTLYLIRGLPGSGKSTFAYELAKSLDIYSFEADMSFYDDFGKYNFDPSRLHLAHKWCQERVENTLFHGMSVVVSDTSTTEKEVTAYHDIAKRYGAKFVSMIVENRHGNVSIHDVPEASIDKMRQRFSIKL